MSSPTEVVDVRHQFRIAPRLSDTLLLALAIGCICGDIESLVSLTKLNPHLHLLSWVLESTNIVWIAPVVITALFECIALFAWLFRSYAPEFQKVLATIFISLTTYDVLFLLTFDRLERYSILCLACGIGVTCVRYAAPIVSAARPRFLRITTGVVLVTAVYSLMAIFVVGREEKPSNVPPLIASTSPNLLLIVIDTLRADHVSSYGYPRLTTPTIDGLAKQGVLFENAYATSSWTLPSHVSLFTGRLPHEHETQFETSVYDDRYPLLAQFLQSRGYATASFSANALFVKPSFGFMPGFAVFENHSDAWFDKFARITFGHEIAALLRYSGFTRYQPGRWYASDIVDPVIRWVAATQGQRRPYFCFVNLFDAHLPYLPPEPFRTQYQTENSNKAAKAITAYDGAIAYTDQELNRLLEGLKKKVDLRNTIVIVTSDHGEGFGDHGLIGHGNSLYRELLHVPIILSWPGHVPAIRITDPVSLTSIPATVTQLVGLRESPFPGPSLARLWQTSTGQSSTYVLSELQIDVPNRPPEARCNHRVSLIGQQWHYISCDNGTSELYNWRSDPQEIKNIVSTPEGKEVEGSLQLTLEEQRGARWAQ